MTHIDGYRLAPGTNPLTFIQKARTILDPIRDRLDAVLLSSLTLYKIDHADRRGDARPEVPVLDRYLAWEDRQQKMPADARGKDPNGFEALFGWDETSGRHLVRVYAEQREYIDAFNAMDGVQEYCYNDGVRADWVSDEEWADRKRTWEQLVPAHSAPSEHMLRWTLRSESNPRTMMLMGEIDESSPLIRYAPSRVDRAHVVAASLYSAWLMNTKACEANRAIIRAKLADKSELVKAIAPVLAEPTPDLFLKGIGTHGFDDLREQFDDLCATVVPRAKHDA